MCTRLNVSTWSHIEILLFFKINVPRYMQYCIHYYINTATHRLTTSAISSPWLLYRPTITQYTPTCVDNHMSNDK